MSKEANETRALDRLADGTVKQKNLLTGTEVWTVPGRGHRPLQVPNPEATAIDHANDGQHCAFCEDNYLKTPPEKSRVVRSAHGHWDTLTQVPPSRIFETKAEFRRIPNLFEIVSYNYWALNHGHTPSQSQLRRMAAYLADPVGYDHVISIIKNRLQATGISAEDVDALDDSQLLPQANSFFSGGHDLIVARRHYRDDAQTSADLASSGSLTPEEHFHYMDFTAGAMADLYTLNKKVRYVACFQNWLKPAGASFDHLHKQLVAIDEHSVQTEAELGRLRKDPQIYDKIISVAATRQLLIAQNDYALALAGIGHRYPSVAIWPLGPSINPWEASQEQMRGVSDLVHAIHAATGSAVPCNEEWYHRPPDVPSPMRWRMLIKWRISTLAGFEGGTRIYLNTIDPWSVRDRLLPELERLRAAGKIAPMRLGADCKVDASDLR